MLGQRFPEGSTKPVRCALNPNCPLATDANGMSNLYGDRRCYSILEILGSFSHTQSDETIQNTCRQAQGLDIHDSAPDNSSQ